ncbi:MAG: hypothetical protein WA061_02180 [Microgenomates group bacterium]
MKLEDIVISAININKDNRKYMPESTFHSLSTVGYVLDFCTIHIDIGRQTGKTYFIQNYARSWDLIIVPNESLKRIYLMSTPSDLLVLTPEEVMGYKFETPPETIYFDEPKLCFKRVPKEDLFYKFIKNKNQTVVMLGQ